MKIAAISDIHSNVFALEAVFDEIQKHNVDMIVNLGDILYGPIAPRQTYDLLMENECVTIQGNQDRQIYQADVKDIASNPTLAFILEDLGNAPLQWLSTLPETCQLSEQVFLCQGTPDNDLVYLLEDVAQGFPILRPERDILTLLNGQPSEVILCGHTHIPRTVTTQNGQIIVNPGSVGLPAYTDDKPVIHSMENHSSHAHFAILQPQDTGWNVQQINVAYDHEKAAAAAKARHRPDWAHFLTTGRGLAL